VEKRGRRRSYEGESISYLLIIKIHIYTSAGEEAKEGERTTRLQEGTSLILVTVEGKKTPTEQ